MRSDKLCSFPCDVLPTFNDWWKTQILDVIRHVLLLQHPSDLEEVTSRESTIHPPTHANSPRVRSYLARATAGQVQ